MNWISKKIEHAGKRITPVRETVIDFIQKKCVFSAQDIIQTFQRLDKVSIYRTIELLETLDIIHQTVHMDGHQYYELHQDNHHHHTRCLNCHTFACTSCPLPTTTNHHVLTFSTDHCRQCA